MEIGDILIEWSYSGWGRRDKHFIPHTVVRVTPSGRIKTDKGLELNPNLTIRGNNPNRSYISLFTDEIKEEMVNQNKKNKLKMYVHKVNVDDLTPEDISTLVIAFDNISTTEEK